MHGETTHGEDLMVVLRSLVNHLGGGLAIIWNLGVISGGFAGGSHEVWRGNADHQWLCPQSSAGLFIACCIT